MTENTEKKCLNCGHTLSQDAKFCSECGTPLSTQSGEIFRPMAPPVPVMPAFCQNCGCNTPHKIEGAASVGALPTTADGGKVDLTGKNEVMARNVALPSLFAAEMRSYQCQRCGCKSMNVGAPPSSSDGFGGLMRGDDWRPPPEPKQ